jgi:membrane protease YdiL (CAAX protease family)
MAHNEWFPPGDNPKDDASAAAWGLGATIGFSAIILALYSLLQILVATAFVSAAKAEHPELDLEAFTRSLSSNGLCIGVMAVVSGLICTPLTLLFTRLRKNISIRDYIGFKEPLKREWVQWLLILAAFLFLSDGVSLLLHQPIVPPFMVDAYKTASSLPILLFAIVVMAPIFEEVFFRGFLFQGIRYSRLGPIGAVGITSLVWAVIHLQYDLYGMATVLALGLLFGIARLKTDSIHLLMVMHSFVGLVATMETIFFVAGFRG